MGNQSLWEILVPTHANNRRKYRIEHHRAWDEYVRSLSGGLTILKKARGQWMSLEGQLFAESMIPVRIYCTRKNIDQIAEFTLKHYDQKAVMYYAVSQTVVIKQRG